MTSYDTKQQAWVAGKGAQQSWIGRYEQHSPEIASKTALGWKAPFTGQITIRGRALMSNVEGGEITIQITRNEKVIFEPHTLGLNDRDGIETNIQMLNVTKGDLIRFESSGAAKYSNDAVSWASTIAYIQKMK